MNIFELKRSNLKDLPTISMHKHDRYFTVLVFGNRKEMDSGYAGMTIVPTKEKSIPGVLEVFPDSISLEHKDGVTWHMDCLPKSGAIQVWATGDNEIKPLHIWGSEMLYVEAK